MDIVNKSKDIKIISEEEMIEALKKVSDKSDEIRKSYKDARHSHLRCGKVFND